MAIAQLDFPVASAAVVDDLQATLIELIDLSLQAKQAHWNVAGPLFKPVHEELDIIVDICRLTSDDVAERIATIGAEPDGRATTVAKARALDQLPAGLIETAHAVMAIGGQIDSLVIRLRERIVRLAEPDPVSQGILITISEQLEKQAWMLRKQIP